MMTPIKIIDLCSAKGDLWWQKVFLKNINFNSNEANHLKSLTKHFSSSAIKVLFLQNELFYRNSKGSIYLSITGVNRFALQMKNVYLEKVRKRKKIWNKFTNCAVTGLFEISRSDTLYFGASLNLTSWQSHLTWQS